MVSCKETEVQEYVCSSQGEGKGETLGRDRELMQRGVMSLVPWRLSLRTFHVWRCIKASSQRLPTALRFHSKCLVMAGKALRGLTPAYVPACSLLGHLLPPPQTGATPSPPQTLCAPGAILSLSSKQMPHAVPFCWNFLTFLSYPLYLAIRELLEFSPP